MKFKHQYQREERLLLRAASALALFVGVALLLSGARNPTPVTRYKLWTSRGYQEIIESKKMAHQVVRGTFPDVIGQAVATDDGLRFESPSQGTVYISWTWDK